MKVRKKIEEVGETAFKYEKDYGDCPQAVCGAFKDIFDFPSKDVFRAVSGIQGGIGKTQNCCGALIGGALVIGSKSGRKYENFDQDSPIECDRMVKKLVNRFQKEYGAVNCADIQEKIMGRSFNFWDEKEWEAFEEAGGHTEKCPSVCKNAAIWTAEILNENDLIFCKN